VGNTTTCRGDEKGGYVHPRMHDMTQGHPRSLAHNELAKWVLGRISRPDCFCACISEIVITKVLGLYSLALVAPGLILHLPHHRHDEIRRSETVFGQQGSRHQQPSSDFPSERGAEKLWYGSFRGTHGEIPRVA
jgi:hypothetical protein